MSLLYCIAQEHFFFSSFNVHIETFQLCFSPADVSKPPRIFEFVIGVEFVMKVFLLFLSFNIYLMLRFS